MPEVEREALVVEQASGLKVGDLLHEGALRTGKGAQEVAEVGCPKEPEGVSIPVQQCLWQ